MVSIAPPKGLYRLPFDHCQIGVAHEVHLKLVLEAMAPECVDGKDR